MDVTARQSSNPDIKPAEGGGYTLTLGLELVAEGRIVDRPQVTAAISVDVALEKLKPEEQRTIMIEALAVETDKVLTDYEARRHSEALQQVLTEGTADFPAAVDRLTTARVAAKLKAEPITEVAEEVG